MWKYNTTPPASDYLIHYGVKGRSGKKGAGLYYRDGELTEEGKRHYYGDGERQPSMSKTGMYGHMKTGREAKKYLKELVSLNKESIRSSKDKQYKSEVKSVNKEYKSLAKQYSRKKLTDIDRVNLHKAQEVIDQKYCDITTAALRRALKR